MKQSRLHQMDTVLGDLQSASCPKNGDRRRTV